jgi:hypothetical protein
MKITVNRYFLKRNVIKIYFQYLTQLNRKIVFKNINRKKIIYKVYFLNIVILNMIQILIIICKVYNRNLYINIKIIYIYLHYKKKSKINKYQQK